MAQVPLVEDDDLIREMLAEALAEAGFNVRVAHNDIEAIAAIDAFGPHLDAVVTDINLGCAATGFDLAKRVREVNPSVRIVYMTGLPSNIRAADGEALMFPKPFDVGELTRQLRSVLGEG